MESAGHVINSVSKVRQAFGEIRIDAIILCQVMSLGHMFEFNWGTYDAHLLLRFPPGTV